MGTNANGVTLNDAADVTLAGAGSIKLDNIDTLGKDHDVLIDASELGGGLTIGDIKSDQKVDLDVKDVLGDIKVGAITGKDVEIDASGAINGIKIGNGATPDEDGVTDITIESSLIFTGSELKANSADIDINEDTTDTSTTIELNGGLEDDVFTITGARATESLTVSGDLGSSKTTAIPDSEENLKKGDLIGIDVSGNNNGVTVDTSEVENASVAIKGGDGNDTIKVGDGINVILAGAGDDTITLGDGVDIIIRNGDGTTDKTDTINNFTAGAKGRCY